VLGKQSNNTGSNGGCRLSKALQGTISLLNASETDITGCVNAVVQFSFSGCDDTELEG